MITIDTVYPLFKVITDVGSYIMTFFYTLGELFQFDILNNNLSQFSVDFVSPLNNITYSIDFGGNAITEFISNIFDSFTKLANTLPLIIANETTKVYPFGLAILSMLIGLMLAFFFIKLFINIAK